jgi:hypothetical protein
MSTSPPGSPKTRSMPASARIFAVAAAVDVMGLLAG